MKKNFNISQILVYYDLPELFVAFDNVGTNYMCMLVSADNGNTTYISTAISVKRLNNFFHSKIDLRCIFENPEIKEWFVFDKFGDNIESNLVIYSLPDGYLPEHDFFYQEEIENDDVITNEVIEINNAVVHLAISDNEDNYSIDADSLGDIVKLYQVIIENSFKKVQTQFVQKGKKSFNVPNNYKLRAFAASHGSFNLHLYSTSYRDLWGNAIIEIGLNKFDEITRDFENEDDLISALRTVKGHTLSCLMKLVKKLIENNIKVKHKWFAPNHDKVHYTIIDKAKAEKIYKVLNFSQELTEEIKIFVGHFVQVDVAKGTWRIYSTDDEKFYNGEATGQALQGVTVETVYYRLICKEIIEEFKVTEKEKTKYLLQQMEKLD
jgi:hypothetical protein